MPLLDEIADRQPVMAKAHRNRDDETHMRLRQAMQRALVMIVTPSRGESPLFLAVEKRRGPRRGGEMTVQAHILLRHERSSIGTANPASNLRRRITYQEWRGFRRHAAAQ